MSSPSCPLDLSPLDLERLVDGELGAAEAAELRAHVAACETCTAELEALQELNATLRARLRQETAPPRLRARVGQILEGDAAAAPNPADAGLSRRGLGFAALGALAASVATAAVLPKLMVSRLEPGDIAGTLVRDFETFLFAERVLDFVEADPSSVAAWYRARLDFDLPRLPADLSGYRLRGGRLCWLLDRRLASLSFEGGEDSLALYIMPSDGLALPESGRTAGGLRDASVHHRDRFTNVIWREGDLVLGLVGEAAPERVEEIARAFSRNAAD